MKLSTREFLKTEFIDFHTHEKDFPAETLSMLSIELSDLASLALDNLDNKFFSIGLHPWRLPQNTDNLLKDFTKLEKELKLPKVIAVGETGLDTLWGPDLKVQEAYFSESIKLARKFNIPMIILSKSKNKGANKKRIPCDANKSTNTRNK